MTKKYEKPMALVNNTLSEGVYLASGAETCYTANGVVVQDMGNNTYNIQINANHHGDHTSEKQMLVISFNVPVNFVSCSNAQYVSGNGTNTLTCLMSYHQNPSDNIGLGDFRVTADTTGLSVTGVTVSCPNA